ncbi:WD40 repeat domain-containing protein [Candidatus Babeliales bacterium]|nr:WD40 repeat domain-containing protein [Candidatus Babeliales bacterium]
MKRFLSLSLIALTLNTPLFGAAEPSRVPSLRSLAGTAMSQHSPDLAHLIKTADLARPVDRQGPLSYLHNLMPGSELLFMIVNYCKEKKLDSSSIVQAPNFFANTLIPFDNTLFIALGLLQGAYLYENNEGIWQQTALSHDKRINAAVILDKNNIITSSDEQTQEWIKNSETNEWDARDITTIIAPFRSTIAVNEKTFLTINFSTTVCVWTKNSDNIWTNSTNLVDNNWFGTALKLDDQTIATGFWNGTIKIWTLNQEGQWLCTTHLTGEHQHHGTVCCLAKLTDNTFISGANDGVIKLWRRNYDGSWIWVTDIENPAYPQTAITSLSILDNSTFFALDKNYITLWVNERGTTWKPRALENDRLTCLTTLGKNTLVTGNLYGKITLQFLPRTLQELCLFQKLTESVVLNLEPGIIDYSWYPIFNTMPTLLQNFFPAIKTQIYQQTSSSVSSSSSSDSQPTEVIDDSSKRTEQPEPQQENTKRHRRK